MSSKEAINMPTTITLMGKDYKIRAVGILKILGIVENYIVEQRLNKIRKVAQLLDHEDRVKYITEQGDKLPEGDALGELASELMISGNMPNKAAIEVLFEALRKDQSDLTLDDTADIFSNAAPEDQSIAMQMMIGSKNDQSPAKPQSGKSRKFTAGRRK